MASLSPGVLVRLLADMDLGEKTFQKPALLQIRGIVPIMEDGDLWPNQGFYLKVSDSTHAIYVSLPHEHDKMILNDKLQLGQFIYVRELESANPVPIIRGVKPVPGTRPCIGAPVDLVPVDNLLRFDRRSFSDSESKAEVVSYYLPKRPAEKAHSWNASGTRKNEQNRRKALHFPPTPTNHVSQKYDVDDEYSTIRKEPSTISITCSEKDSDSDSSNSSCSTMPVSRRRSWDRTEMAGSFGTKHETKPLTCSQNALVSPNRLSRYYSLDDYSKLQSRRKGTRSAMKQLARPLNEKNGESFNMAKPSMLHSTRIWTETKVSWASLPSNLMKLGKDVLHHRDAALRAAVEALEEAAAAERLIQCLSTYSELQTNKKDDPQHMVDSLLDLHDNLTQSNLIVQSLNKSSLPKTDTNSTTSRLTRETVKLLLERKKFASSWIRAALASDLSPVCFPVQPITPLAETTETTKKLSPPTRCGKSKDFFSLAEQRNNCEILFALTVKDNPTDWVKGSSLRATTGLANDLISECRQCFVTNVEKFLDGVTSKSISTASDSQVASAMCWIKRVDDCLDGIMCKETCLSKDGHNKLSMTQDEEQESHDRVRKKLYGVLLMHVERSAIALESLSSASQA